MLNHLEHGCSTGGLWSTSGPPECKSRTSTLSWSCSGSAKRKFLGGNSFNWIRGLNPFQIAVKTFFLVFNRIRGLNPWLIAVKTFFLDWTHRVFIFCIWSFAKTSWVPLTHRRSQGGGRGFRTRLDAVAELDEVWLDAVAELGLVLVWVRKFFCSGVKMNLPKMSKFDMCNSSDAFNSRSCLNTEKAQKHLRLRLHLCKVQTVMNSWFEFWFSFKKLDFNWIIFGWNKSFPNSVHNPNFLSCIILR